MIEVSVRRTYDSFAPRMKTLPPRQLRWIAVALVVVGTGASMGCWALHVCKHGHGAHPPYSWMDVGLERVALVSIVAASAFALLSDMRGRWLFVPLCAAMAFGLFQIQLAGWSQGGFIEWVPIIGAGVIAALVGRRPRKVPVVLSTT